MEVVVVVDVDRPMTALVAAPLPTIGGGVLNGLILVKMAVEESNQTRYHCGAIKAVVLHIAIGVGASKHGKEQARKGVPTILPERHNHRRQLQKDAQFIDLILSERLTGARIC
jgi:hypothetical protein